MRRIPCTLIACRRCDQAGRNMWERETWHVVRRRWRRTYLWTPAVVVLAVAYVAYVALAVTW